MKKKKKKITIFDEFVVYILIGNKVTMLSVVDRYEYDKNSFSVNFYDVSCPI